MKTPNIAIYGNTNELWNNISNKITNGLTKRYHINRKPLPNNNVRDKVKTEYILKIRLRGITRYADILENDTTKF